MNPVTLQHLVRCTRRSAVVMTTSVLLAAFVVWFILYLRISQKKRSSWLAGLPHLNSSAVHNMTHTEERPISVLENGDVSVILKCVDPSSKGGVEDTFCLQRPSYLPNYKNPCWIEPGAPKHLRCLPYFHLLGVDKSATTDLFARLMEHPHMVENGGVLGKETFYWCWLKYGERQWMRTVGQPMMFNKYINFFNKAAGVIAINNATITGDGTPVDFWDFRAWRLIPQNEGLEEPAVVTPHLMRHMYRDPKFIIILRNPTERLYSDYLFLGYGWSPEKFRQDVPHALDLMQSCLKVNTTRQCVFSNHTYVTMPMRLHLGMYSVFMREWLAVFPRSSFHILRTEDFARNITGQLRLVYDFLGLEQLTDQQIEMIASKHKRHETEVKKRVNDMFPETRAQLDSFYAKYKLELADMLQDHRFLWIPQ